MVRKKYDQNFDSVCIFRITSLFKKQQNKKVNSKNKVLSKIRTATVSDEIENKIYFIQSLISLHCNILINNKRLIIVMNKNILWGVICVDVNIKGGLNKRRLPETRAA